jgi:hypothetical protein
MRPSTTVPQEEDRVHASAETSDNFLAHFIGLQSNTRPDGCDQLTGLTISGRAQTGNSLGNNAFGGAAPTGMDSANDPWSCQ